MSAEDKKYHYTYLIETACRKYYIGYRSSDVEPHLDPYMGSPRCEEAKRLLYATTSKKIVLGIYSTREEAAQDEIDLHNEYDVAVNPLFLNKAKSTSTGFDTYGTTLTDEHRQKVSEANKGKTLPPKTRQKMSEARTGKNNPRYDSTIYTFYNIKTGEIVCDTKYNFYTERGLHKSHLNKVIKGRRRHTKGWKVLCNLP